MADGTQTGSGAAGGRKSAPNFYSAAADMGGYKPGGQSPDASASSSASSVGQPEKAQSVATLLDVLRKMEKQETDQAAKDILQQMASLAEQYMEKVSPGASKTAGAATGPTGSAGTATPPSDTSAGSSTGAAATGA